MYANQMTDFAAALRLDKRNIWFNGMTTRGRVRWALAFVMPSCCNYPTFIWHWSVVLFVVTLVPSILDVTTRSAVASDFIQRIAASELPVVVINGTFVPPPVTPICRGVTTCRGPPWPFALGDWTFFWTLLYAVTRWMLVCSSCGEENWERLKATNPLPWLARVCWVSHVLALTPTLVELTMFVSVRGPDDPEITTIALGLRTGFLLADFVLGLVPVFVEHVVWIWVEATLFVFMDLCRQYVGGHSSAYAGLTHSDFGLGALVMGCALALIYQVFFFVVLTMREKVLNGVSVFEPTAPSGLYSAAVDMSLPSVSVIPAAAAAGGGAVTTQSPSLV